MTMLVAVVITENDSVKRELLCPGFKKSKDMLKAIEMVDENVPICKLEHRCQVSQKIQFFLLMMDLERSETCRGYK
jgi:hypothetical protein